MFKFQQHQNNMELDNIEQSTERPIKTSLTAATDQFLVPVEDIFTRSPIFAAVSQFYHDQGSNLENDSFS